MISIISAIGKNNEIGKGNALLWDLPLDMKHFKETTEGHTIIMGQKTFESIGRPLPNRRNIVLTKDESFKSEGIETVFSVEEALALLEESDKGGDKKDDVGNNKDGEEKNDNKENDQEDNKESFIIGGGQIYRLFFGKAHRLYITCVHAEFPEADTFFPNIDLEEWKLVSEEPHFQDEKHAYDFSFCVYERII